MNFLSHFYFEKDNCDSYLVMGTVLPDLIKNGKKEWNLYPQKKEAVFLDEPLLHSMLLGWKRHLEVDRLFHSSAFFFEETARLKQLILPLLEQSKVRPSFLAHIGVELMLDHLLVEHQQVNINSFYGHLESVEDKVLTHFLQKCGADHAEVFLKFMSGFKSSRYLFSYQKIENISYALQRICMRLWTHPFDESTTGRLTAELALYKRSLEVNYMDIFREMERKMG